MTDGPAPDRASDGGTRVPGRAVMALVGALSLVGCATETPFVPRDPGTRFDLSGLVDVAGLFGIEPDTIALTLRRTEDSSVAVAEALPVNLVSQLSGLYVVRVELPLTLSREDFYLHVELRRGGLAYYAVNTIVSVIAGLGVSTPALMPSYVGPGSAADSLVFLIVPPLLLAGDSVLAAALVFDQGAPLSLTPVGYLSGDTSQVRVHRGPLGAAWLVADRNAHGAVPITALTPTGLSRAASLTVLAPPTLLRMVAGDGQQLPLGLTTQPLVVQVLDVLGQPFVGGLPVDFGLIGPIPLGTTLTQQQVISDSQGFASTRVVGGSVAGLVPVTATGQGLTSAPVQFLTTLVPTLGGLASLTPVSTVLQSTVVNQLVAAAPAVLLQDSAGLPVAGVPVSFAILSGSGVLNGLGPIASTPTDNNGVARLTSWRVGKPVGDNLVQAAVSGLTPVGFSSGTAPTAVASLQKLAGDGQSGLFNTLLPQPLVAGVVDSFGNPVAGVPVNWSATDGQLSPASPVSDASGHTQAGWTLGTLLSAPTATASSGAISTVFRATTILPAATSLVKLAGDSQQVPIGQLSAPLVVQVLDQTGQPFGAGFPVDFGLDGPIPLGSGLTTSHMVTDSRGQAATRVQAGSVAGLLSVVGTGAGLQGSPVRFLTSLGSPLPSPGTGNPAPHTRY